MNNRFLDACRRRPTDVRPVWFMRQAGRYMKQYRDIRAKTSILEICKRPDLAAAVTLQPVEVLDVDAAIIFSDILVVPEAMGLTYEMIEVKGPIFRKTIQSLADVKAHLSRLEFPQMPLFILLTWCWSHVAGTSEVAPLSTVRSWAI